MKAMNSQQMMNKNRKQSRIDHPVESLWYFSESSGDSFFPSERKNSGKEQELRTEGYHKFPVKEKNQLVQSRANTFVVDWQIED